MEQEEQREAGGAPPKKEYLLVKNAYEWVESIALAVIAVVLVFTFLLRIVGVDGQSMEPTLQSGDFVVISDLFYTPQNGDVVVIAPTPTLEVPIIKRVVALEGQTVDIDFQNGVVYVDQKALSEPYTAEPTTLYYDIKFPQKVPPGHVFVMGDNRNHSLDSRDSSIGMLDKRYIMGKALLRVLPIRQFGLVY